LIDADDPEKLPECGSAGARLPAVNADGREIGGECSSEIVKYPTGHAAIAIELRLLFDQPSKASFSRVRKNRARKVGGVKIFSMVPSGKVCCRLFFVWDEGIRNRFFPTIAPVSPVILLYADREDEEFDDLPEGIVPGPRSRRA